MSREGGEEKGDEEEEAEVAWFICSVERIIGAGSPTNGASRCSMSRSMRQSDLQE